MDRFIAVHGDHWSLEGSDSEPSGNYYSKHVQKIPPTHFLGGENVSGYVSGIFIEFQGVHNLYQVSRWTRNVEKPSTT